MTEEIRTREGSANDLERLETMWIDFYETQRQQGMFVRISRDGFQQWVASIRPILADLPVSFWLKTDKTWLDSSPVKRALCRPILAVVRSDSSLRFMSARILESMAPVQSWSSLPHGGSGSMGSSGWNYRYCRKIYPPGVFTRNRDGLRN